MSFADLRSTIESNEKTQLDRVKGKSKTVGYDFNDQGVFDGRKAAAFKKGGAVKAKEIKAEGKAGFKRLDKPSRSKKAEGGSTGGSNVTMEDKLGMNDLVRKAQAEQQAKSGEKDPTRGSKYAGEKDYKKGGMIKKAAGGKIHSDEAQDKKLIKKMIAEKGKFKSGGAVKGKTTVNVIVAPQGGGAGLNPDAMAMKPAVLPPMAAAPIPAMPMPPRPAPVPFAANQGPQGLPVPPMPAMRKSGGRVPHMTAGAASGVGRLELAKNAKK